MWDERLPAQATWSTRSWANTTDQGRSSAGRGFYDYDESGKRAEALAGPRRPEFHPGAADSDGLPLEPTCRRRLLFAEALDDA